MWTNLIVNLANVSLLILVLQLMLDRIEDVRSTPVRFVFGVICGLSACLSMTLAEPIRPGFIFDLRGPLIACAAFFGGPLALLPSGLIASAFRIQMGGNGVLPGLVSIWAIGAAALAVRGWMGNRPPQIRHLVLMVLGVAGAFSFSYLFVSAPMRSEIFLSTAAPMTVLNSLATMLIAMLLQREIRRKAMERSNAIYRQMVDSLPDCLNAKDLNGRFLAANPATADLMKAASAEDLIGKSDMDFYPGDKARRFRREELDVLQSGQTRAVEQEIRTSSGQEHWVATLKVPLRDPSGRVAGVITHNRDVSHERKMSRMKSEFISTVSHELRTPLTSIRGALSLVASGVKGDLPPDVLKLVTMAKRNSDRLVLLINDLLDIDKIETGKMKFNYSREDLGNLLRDAIASNANYRPEMRVTAHLVNKAPGLTADVDAHRMTQVVANILSNAVKFSPVGGQVHVLLEQPDDRHARITIRDEGRGVPPEFAERIFGKFEQVDASDSKQKEGTGLGLHISRRIVEDMGGRIVLKTGQAVGAAFEIEMPLRNATVVDAPPLAAAALPSEAPAAPPARLVDPIKGPAERPTLSRLPQVLYAEDDRGLGEYVSHALAPDVETTQVGTLTEARTALAERPFDLVILDRYLPDGSGLSLIKALPEDVPIVTFTADEFDDPLRARISSRMIKTLVNEAELASEIRRLLREVRISRSQGGPVSVLRASAVQ